MPPVPREHAYTRNEEIANCVSHGIGLLAALVAVPLLIGSALRAEAAAGLVGAIVFGATIIVLYAMSTLYHALPRGRAKRVARVLDHAAIFLLIAGTYTPFTLGVLRGPWGWTVLVLIWALCLTGIVIKVGAGGVHRPRLSIGLYLAAGWLIIIAAKPMLTLVPAWGLAWLVAGGLAYTGGVWFYRARHLHAHLLWHLCVIAGTACHFVAVAGYATPPAG